MNEPEKIFDSIIARISLGIEGKMFGARCIKSPNGKTAAFYWKEDMVFKLENDSQKEALNLKNSKIGTHLYAPDKQMNGWVLIPKEHSIKWIEFTEKALKYVESLGKTTKQKV